MFYIKKVQFGMRCVLLKVAIGLNIAELIQERIKVGTKYLYIVNHTLRLVKWCYVTVAAGRVI